MRAGLLFSFVCATAWAATAPVAEPGTLKWALERGLAPEFREADAIREQGDAGRSAARGRLLPTLSVSTSFGVGGSDPKVSDTPWTSGTKLTLSQLIYDNGATWSRASIADKARDRLAIEAQRKRDDLSFEIVNAFLDLASANRSLELEKQRVDVLDRQFKLVSYQYKQGQKPLRDFSRFEAQALRAANERRTAEDVLRGAVAKLARLVGLPEDEIRATAWKPVEGEMLVPGLKLDAANISAESWPAWKAAGLSVEEADLQARIVEREAWPRLSANATTEYGSQAYIDTGRAFRDNDALTWNVGLSLDVTLWDWKVRQREADVQRAAAARVRAQADREQLKLRDTADQLGRDLRRRSESLASFRRLRDIEASTFRRLESDYREAKVQYLDLLSGLDNSLNADLGYVNERAAYVRDQASLLTMEGRLYEVIVNAP